MICSKCNKEVADGSLFCQWCGAELALDDLEAMVRRIKQLWRQDDLAAASIIHQIYSRELHLMKYPNFTEFGKKELGLEKAQIYNYNLIAERFMDSSGNLLITGGKAWTIGKLL